MGSFLLEVQSLRWHGHYVGDSQKYRPRKEIEEAMKFDCIANFEEFLFQKKILSKRDAEKIRNELSLQIEEGLSFARQSPAPDPTELMEDLWA